MIQCSACGNENPTGQRFCDECGAALARTCPACGTLVRPQAKFCGECRSPLADAAGETPEAKTSDVRTGGAAEVTAPSQLAATERRLVSVLFADLVGFTALSESRDSEEVRDLLSRYFDTCRTIIVRYGGVVEKFIGDAVMAVWGTPVANEDDAERAVRAALELAEAVRAMGGEIGDPGLQVRAGVLTGEATVNIGATGEGMVAGDLVNTASRIQSAAEPGTVLVGEATKRSTDAAVAYADAGVHTLKGKSEPIRLWLAVRVVAGVGGAQKSTRLEAPFVGRDRELRMIKDLLHETIQDGKAHLVSVVGIAGIGKSRLAWEVFKYIDGLRQSIRWHRGRCLSYGEGVTYWALAEMVRTRAGILEGEDAPSARVKLTRGVAEVILDPQERAWIEPRLSQLLGLEDRSSTDRDDLFAAWRLFYERLADDMPTVMLFEDVQWADASLLDFIEYLMEWSRNHALFVITLARPEMMDRRATWGAGRRNFTSLFLEALPERSMAELLSGLVPGLPTGVQRAILDRAEGVPLYAMETVRMLLDRGLLVETDGTYRPAGEIESLAVPETLHALIAARLDVLEPQERTLVQDASVLGKTFTRQAAGAVTSLPEAAADAVLASLVRKEILSIQADPRSPERGQYGFLQDLVRTVAYATLSKRDRKARHLAVARYLQEAWGSEEEEIVEVVASHYVEAYRLAPDAEDSGSIRDQGRRMLARAAERAASLAAAEEAETYFEQASELTDSGLERAELLERAGQMAIFRGLADQAARRYEDARRLFEEAGQLHSAARLEGRLAEVDFLHNRVGEAIERMARAHAALSDDEPDADLAIVAAQLGRFLAVSGRHVEATPLLEEALRLAEHLELPELYSQALSSRALGLVDEDRLDQAITLLRRALAVALEHGFTAAAFRAYNNLNLSLEALDRFTEGLEVSGQAIALARRTGDRVQELFWTTQSILTAISAGRWDQALEWAESAEGAREVAALEWVGAGRMDVVTLRVRRGELGPARQLMDEFADMGTADNLELRAIYQRVLAELLRAEGRLEEALVAAEAAVAARERFGVTSTFVKRGLVEAVEAALGLGDTEKAEELLGIVGAARPGQVTPFLRAQVARLTARIAAAVDDVDSVEPGFAAAETGFRGIGVPFDLAVALLEHAEWLKAQGRAEEGETMLTEARDIFERLDAKPWVERVARMTGAERAPSLG